MPLRDLPHPHPYRVGYDNPQMCADYDDSLTCPCCADGECSGPGSDCMCTIFGTRCAYVAAE